MSSKSWAAKTNKELLFTLLRWIDSGKEFDAQTHARKLQYIKKQKYIASRSNGTYTLTARGRHMLSESAVWNLSISTPKQWGKKWYVVLFDIPHDKRKRRDAFRLRLKELGLTLYQNSVWIYPHPLEEPISKIADFYMLSKYISIMAAEKVTGEKKLKERYSLN